MVVELVQLVMGVEMGKSIKCANPECRADMGMIVEVDRVELLKIGNSITRSHHGVCAICGAEFHWSVGDRALWMLVTHAIELRGKITAKV